MPARQEYGVAIFHLHTYGTETIKMHASALSHIWIELNCSFNFKQKSENWKLVLEKLDMEKGSVGLKRSAFWCHDTNILHWNNNFCSRNCRGSIGIDGVHQIWHWQSNYRQICVSVLYLVWSAVICDDELLYRIWNLVVRGRRCSVDTVLAVFLWLINLFISMAGKVSSTFKIINWP